MITGVTRSSPYPDQIITAVTGSSPYPDQTVTAVTRSSPYPDQMLDQHLETTSTALNVIVLFCFIVCYLLNMLLFYLKYDVCSQNVTYNLINMLKVFQSIGAVLKCISELE